MSTNHHAPIVPGESNSAATWNTRFSTLDSAIDAQTSVALDAIDAIIIESGTSDAETIAARTAINYLAGAPPATLGAALELAAGNLYNVLAYGAVANGVTDDTGAIQDAIDAAAAGGGGRVWFPTNGAGYKVDGQIVLASNVWLMSDGATIDATGGASRSVIFAVSKSNIRISGLRYMGENTDGAGAAVVPISLESCSNVWIDQNYIDIAVIENNINTSAIAIVENSTVGVGTDFYNVFITDNVIRPAFLGILVQSRQADDPVLYNLQIVGNIVDYVNCNASSQSTGYGCAIKVDANIVGVVVAHNICDGRSFCRDGINVQEDITDAAVSNNVIRNFTRYALTLAAGQNVLAVVNATVIGNIINNVDMVTAPNPASEVGRGISINPSTNTNWRNISVIGNIVNESDGWGIYEDASHATNRILNYLVEGNTVTNSGNVGIWVRSHQANVRNNTVTGAAVFASLTVTGSAEKVLVTGNRFDQKTGTVYIDGNGVDVRSRNNVFSGVFDEGIKTGTVFINRWIATDDWSLECIIYGLTLTANVTTTIDTGINVLEYGTGARGAYHCEGSIVGGSSSSNVVAGTFSAYMRMTSGAVVDSQGGSFSAASSATMLNDVSLDTNLTDIQLKFVSTNATESVDNVMIRFRLSKTDDL